MDQSKITVRYAKAFFSLAKEKNQIEALRADVERIAKLCHDSTEFRLLLDSPVIKTGQKIKLVRSILGPHIGPLSLNFAELVFTNRRESDLPGICRNFLVLCRQDLGVKTAVITTAVALDDSILNSIQTKLEAAFHARVELSKQVDQKLIGGFVLRVDDQQIDASISSQLRKVKEELIQSEIK